MFAILLTDHPIWKYTLKPVILKDDRGKSYSIDSYIHSKNVSSFELTKEQKLFVDTCEHLQEANLIKLFVREKISVADFQKKFFTLPHSEMILNNVEKYLYKLSRMVVEYHFPLYFKKKTFLNIYPSDDIVVSKCLDDVQTNFELKDGDLNYSLFMIVEGATKKVPIVTQVTNVIPLSNDPCAMVLNHQLYVFEQCTYKKISTFFTKAMVTVPSNSVDNYMRGFVTKTLLAGGNVQTNGFQVHETNPRIQPLLTLTTDLSMRAVLKLSFLYDDQVVDSMDDRQRIVSMDASDYTFSCFERNRDEELVYRQYLTDLGLFCVNDYYYVDNSNRTQDERQSMLQFLIDNKDQLQDYKLEQNMEDVTYLIEPMHLDLQMQERDMDWFELRGTVYVSGFEIPFYKIRENLINGDPYLQLPDGTVALLPEEWFEKYSDVLNMSEVSDDEHLVYRMHYAGAMDGVMDTKVISLDLDEPVDVPDNVKAELRSYQKLGYYWLMALYKKNMGGCLADDMGLGKTLQFLTFLRAIYPTATASVQQNTDTPWPYAQSEPSLFDQLALPQSESLPVEKEERKPATLVVLPTSLLFNWVKEKEKFTPSLTHLVYAGERRVKSSQIGRIFNHYHLIFTTYGVVRNDIEYLKNYRFECVILDESQNVKNPQSLAYKSVEQLVANHYYCLTGTPIENHLEDLWTQMHLSNRNILGSQHYFKKFFADPILKQSDELRAGLLQRIIKPFLMRRNKKDVATDLPEITEQVVYCVMNDEHRKLYDKERLMISNHIMGMIVNKTIRQNSVAALAAIMQLRQLSNHPCLVEEESKVESSKMTEVVDRLQSLKEEGHKVLIFSSFVKHLELVETEIRKLGYKYSKLTGATQDRQSQVEQFQTDDETVCFLISLKAGGVGLNLTKADYVFLIDPWWNPAAERQAIDRAYRIGQNRNVFVYRFIMKDTIEEKIQLLQAQKQEVVEHFINNNNPFDYIEWEDLF